MHGFGVYLMFLVPPLLIGLWVQSWLKRTVATNAKVPVASGLSGAEVASRILIANGLGEVQIGRAEGGALTDNYDPRKHALFLSQEIHDGRSLTSTAVAAHEVGHAIQHARAYRPMQIRSLMFPAVAFASQAWFFLLMIGAVMGVLGMVQFALVLFAVVVLFQLVTLPVEFDASRRASSQLRALGLVTESERRGVNSVLKAAGSTYIAGALASLAQLAYFAMAFGGNRN
jgi:Zn-dependent membrane protease YugP